MSEYLSLGFGIPITPTLPSTGIDWGLVPGAGSIDQGSLIPAAEGYIPGFTPPQMEQPEIDMNEPEDSSGLTVAEGGYENLQDLANLLYSVLYGLYSRALGSRENFLLRKNLEEEMIMVGGVLHIESLQGALFDLLNRDVYDIGLLPKADIPSLSTKIEIMVYQMYPLLSFPIKHLMAEKLYLASSKIIVDHGLPGEIPDEDPIEDEGTVIDWGMIDQAGVGVDVSGQSGGGESQQSNYTDDQGNQFGHGMPVEKNDNKMIILGLAGLVALLILKK